MSSHIALIFSFQICIKPVSDLLQSANTVLRLSAAGKLMILPVEQAQSGGAAMHSEGSEHLNSIRHPAAVILVRLDEQRRSHTLIRVF